MERYKTDLRTKRPKNDCFLDFFLNRNISNNERRIPPDMPIKIPFINATVSSRSSPNSGYIMPKPNPTRMIVPADSKSRFRYRFDSIN